MARRNHNIARLHGTADGCGTGCPRPYPCRTPHQHRPAPLSCFGTAISRAVQRHHVARRGNGRIAPFRDPVFKPPWPPRHQSRRFRKITGGRLGNATNLHHKVARFDRKTRHIEPDACQIGPAQAPHQMPVGLGTGLFQNDREILALGPVDRMIAQHRKISVSIPPQNHCQKGGMAQGAIKEQTDHRLFPAFAGPFGYGPANAADDQYRCDDFLGQQQFSILQHQAKRRRHRLHRAVITQLG